MLSFPLQLMLSIVFNLGMRCDSDSYFGLNKSESECNILINNKL